MGWLLALLSVLPLVASQSVTSFFRPDNVTKVTGRVVCGNSPAAFQIVEWWQNRGQQIDTLLGSARTDSNGFFQVQSSQAAPARSYIFIKHKCGSQREQSSRFDVNVLSPFNMQIQLRSTKINGPNQLSGRVLCNSNPTSNAFVEWWADRGSQVDVLLGLTQTDGRGNFNVFRNRLTDDNTYIIVKHSCGGNGQQTRFPVDLSRPAGMQLQLRGSGPSNPPRISGTVRCGRQAAVWVPVEWWADRGRQVDVLLGRSKTDGRGFFTITRSLSSDRDTYLMIRHNCDSNRQRTTRVSVSSRNSNNMDIQLSDRDRRDDNSRSH